MRKDAMLTEVHSSFIGVRSLVTIEARGSIDSLNEFRNSIQEHYGDITRQEISQAEESQSTQMISDVYLYPHVTPEALHTHISQYLETQGQQQGIGLQLRDITLQDLLLISQGTVQNMQINSSDLKSLLLLLFSPPDLLIRSLSRQEGTKESSARPCGEIQPVQNANSVQSMTENIVLDFQPMEARNERLTIDLASNIGIGTPPHLMPQQLDITREYTIFFCSRCGSVEVEGGQLEWIDINTGEPTSSESPTGDIWCRECEIHTSLRDRNILASSHEEALRIQQEERTISP